MRLGAFGAGSSYFASAIGLDITTDLVGTRDVAGWPAFERWTAHPEVGRNEHGHEGGEYR
ncbi:MAG: hypothetical protein AAF628_25625 [Planctomycetota bacterium]